MTEKLFEPVTPAEWNDVVQHHLDIWQALNYLQEGREEKKIAKIRVTAAQRESKRARVCEYAGRMHMKVCTHYVSSGWLYIRLIRRNVGPGSIKRGRIPLEERMCTSAKAFVRKKRRKGGPA
jgi:hypothetical protein